MIVVGDRVRLRMDFLRSFIFKHDLPDRSWEGVVEVVELFEGVDLCWVRWDRVSPLGNPDPSISAMYYFPERLELL